MVVDPASIPRKQSTTASGSSGGAGQPVRGTVARAWRARKASSSSSSVNSGRMREVRMALVSPVRRRWASSASVVGSPPDMRAAPTAT